ncbi:N-acetylmuramoyl-L-alanine amidase [Neomoorella glycerini]|uniref:N-acetylmuramoyl-L-alanine amidase n=1 Tax=Neomoorella glycerini TaxID=55779 RepID=A0A6I5ZQN5_9FIRM|nr:peptidoglycan recognition family protein [Moorella glycerini]QGP92304.1 N-acetylmuramoyl-L-alanine amidase [Moorella glycerini]
MRRYHLSLGWRDVGYNYIIEGDGRVVAGRSLDVPGAHCRDAGMNFKSAGVAVIGNLMDHPPTLEQRRALIRLVRDLCRRYNVPPERVLGHREVPGAATVCPVRFMDMGRVRREVVVPGETSISASGQVIAHEETVDWGGPANVTVGEAVAPGEAIAGGVTVDVATEDGFGSGEASQGGPADVTGAGVGAWTREAAHGRPADDTAGAGDENSDAGPGEAGENAGM